MRITDPSDLSRRPRARILELAELIGEGEVARWCADLLAATVAYDDPGRPPLTWLGGPHASTILQMNAIQAKVYEYWPRVWGARGLMYVWYSDAHAAVMAGLADTQWRVREMSAKVVRMRELADAEEALSALVDDSVPRVRVAALLALGHVGEVEQSDVVSRLRSDRDPSVCSAAGRALTELKRRLDLRQ